MLPVSSLSGGNQQKVVIGKWNEHCAQGDVLRRTQRAASMSKPSGRSSTSSGRRPRKASAPSSSSTELEEVLEVADRILVMRQGRIVAEVDPTEITLNDLYSTLHEGSDRMSDAQTTAQRANGGLMPFVRTYTMELILLALVVFLIFTAPGFASLANTLNVLRTVAMLGIIAFGMTAVIIAGRN